jgi:ArsR family transcriptional regulator
MKRKAAIPITDMLAALSEEVRVRVLRLVESEDLTVGEVAKVLQLPQSTVSRHLKVLADAGWLTRRAVGTATIYRLVLDDLAIGARAVWITVRAEIENATEVREDARRLKDVLAERRLDSQAFFGRVAGEWDEVRARLFGNDFTARALLGLLPGDWVVADVGCGTGNASELLAPHVERVVAVDASEPMLEAARKRLKGVANVTFSAGSLESLPIKNSTVDAAVCVLVLHHLKEPLLALREMRRVLRPLRGGGLALVVDMIEHTREEYRQQMGHIHLGFPPDTIRSMMDDAGFSAVSVEPLPTATDAKGPGLFVATGRVGKN